MVDNTSNIEAFALQAFASYGGAVQKQVKMVRFHLLSTNSANPAGNVNVDYDLSDSTAPLSAVVSPALWDTATWDNGIWSSNFAASADWQGATGVGYTFAPVLKISAQGLQLQWVETDMVFEAGGVL